MKTHRIAANSFPSTRRRVREQLQKERRVSLFANQPQIEIATTMERITSMSEIMDDILLNEPQRYRTISDRYQLVGSSARLLQLLRQSQICHPGSNR